MVRGKERKREKWGEKGEEEGGERRGGGGGGGRGEEWGWGDGQTDGGGGGKTKTTPKNGEDRINVGRVCTIAGKPECSFFFPPLSLQLCLPLSLFLSTFLL